MNFLKKLFSKSKNKNDKATRKEPQLSSGKPEMIKVHDEYGRELLITKKDWLNNVLLGNLEKNKNNSDDLYNLLLSALNDNFETHIQSYAEHLYRTDSLKERGACMYAIVLIKNKYFDLAEKVVKETIAEIGETGALLINLAKVYACWEEHKKAEDILWHALEVDPNQDNGLEWYVAIQKEKGGKESYLEALSRVNDLPNAWRPNLWLARESLENENLSEALSYYQRLFEINGNVDAKTLQQISGDLGLKGYISEIIDVVEPMYNIKIHGLMVGNNLLKATIELKRFDKAQSILNGLFSEDRPDWKEGLTYWQNELDKLTHEYGPVKDDEIPKMGLMPIEQPIWLHKLEQVESIYTKMHNSTITILVTSGSCTLKTEQSQIIKQQSNVEGTLCRGVPMTLCDKLNLQTSAQATMMLPIIEEGGFAFFGQKYDTDWANRLIEQYPCDVVLLPHLYAQSDQWQYEICVFDVNEKENIFTFVKDFSPKEASIPLKELVNEVSKFLIEKYGLRNQKQLIDFDTISPHLYAHYVGANESCLALSLACNIENGVDTLYGERSIFDKLLHLAVDEPNSDIHKLMFLSAMAKNKAYGSEIYKEYHSKIKKLFKIKGNKELMDNLIDKQLAIIFDDAN